MPPMALRSEKDGHLLTACIAGLDRVMADQRLRRYPLASHRPTRRDPWSSICPALALQRLGSSELVVHGLARAPDDPAHAGARIVMQWELRGGRAGGTRGTDTFTVQGDRITDQRVALHTPDY